jgi:DNA-binding transcriptional regulator YdaS (Cro superfamily)
MHMTASERKKALGHGGVKRIAERLGVSTPLVSLVLSGQRSNRRVRVAIARAIKVPTHIAFPRSELCTDTSNMQAA